MPLSTRPAALWTLATRTLLPTYGARANAADAVRAGRRSARDRRTAEAALAQLPRQAAPGVGR